MLAGNNKVDVSLCAANHAVEIVAAICLLNVNINSVSCVYCSSHVVAVHTACKVVDGIIKVALNHTELVSSANYRSFNNAEVICVAALASAVTAGGLSTLALFNGGVVHGSELTVIVGSFGNVVAREGCVSRCLANTESAVVGIICNNVGLKISIPFEDSSLELVLCKGRACSSIGHHDILSFLFLILKMNNVTAANLCKINKSSEGISVNTVESSFGNRA